MELLKNLNDSQETVTIKPNLTDNIVFLTEKFSKCFDFKVKKMIICGINAAFICLDGMCDNREIFLSITNPLAKADGNFSEPNALYEAIRDKINTNVQQKDILTLGEAAEGIIGGNLLFLLDGVDRGILFGVQGFPKKSVSEPQSDMQEQGSQEGFVDSSKDNAALIRRRLASEKLCMEELRIGVSSKTRVLICYMRGRVSSDDLEKVKSRLRSVKIDCVSGSGCIEPFLEPKGLRVFKAVGSTERPDVFCAKLTEGKIGIIVDGTPHALILPYFFIEYFHTLDDYLKRPFYALFLRTVKIISFIVGVFLPGIYVAVTMYHPEIIPSEIMYNIVTAQQRTPFPIMAESLVIHLIYEIVREAGLRMPKTVGHTVSIVGALIIGDAAVTAGLISAPMLIIVALTAITTAVISDIQDPVCILRFAFIFLGGFLGMCGIFTGAAALIFNIAAEKPLGIPFTLPAAPFSRSAARDLIIRRDWTVLSKKRYNAAGFTVNNNQTQSGGTDDDRRKN